MIGYEVAIAFNFSFSPLRLGVNPAWLYGLGWIPIALIILIHEVSGFIEPNEDAELLRQRRKRSAEVDQEMGITKKPRWWSRLHGDFNINVQKSISKHVHDIGGGTATTRNVEQSIEMGILPTHKPIDRTEGTFPLSQTSPGMSESSNLSMDNGTRNSFDGRGRPQAIGAVGPITERSITPERSVSTFSETTLNAPAQQIRSMLDV
jgi:hypothetical protein